MEAVFGKKTNCVAVLLEVTDLGITRNDGLNALRICVSSANDDCFQLLLPRVSDVDARTAHRAGFNDGCFNVTALHFACLKGQHKMTKALLRRGASRMARDCMQRTPLHLAAESGHLSCVVRLLGSPGDYKLTPGEVNATGGLSVSTPLHLAAFSGQTHCCGALIAAGARLDVITLDGCTTQMYAQANHPANAELLALLSGRRGPVDAPGTTCYHCGAREAEARLFACSGCYSVRFCGAACSKAAWSAHKNECRRRQAKREEGSKVTCVNSAGEVLDR